MFFLFSEHEPNCTPLHQCFHCRVVTSLRKKLSPEKFDELLKITKDMSKVTFDTPIKSLRFSVRTTNCIRNDDIQTLGDLVRKTDNELRRIHNFGEISLNEVKTYLASIGHYLGELPVIVEK